MKKKLPQSLIKKQESERTTTVAAVTDAIIELESQGYNTRIKDIMYVTGFIDGCLFSIYSIPTN